MFQFIITPYLLKLNVTEYHLVFLIYHLHIKNFNFLRNFLNLIISFFFMDPDLKVILINMIYFEKLDILFNIRIFLIFLSNLYYLLYYQMVIILITYDIKLILNTTYRKIILQNHNIMNLTFQEINIII